MNELRHCFDCHRDKPITDFPFTSSPYKGKRYRLWKCRPCKNADDRRYRLSHLGEKKKASREWYLKNRMAHDLETKRWREAHLARSNAVNELSRLAKGMFGKRVRDLTDNDYEVLFMRRLLQARLKMKIGEGQVFDWMKEFFRDRKETMLRQLQIKIKSNPIKF